MADDPNDPNMMDERGKYRGGTANFLRSALDAYKEASEDKELFIKERLAAEAEERDRRSRDMYEISKHRAEEQAVTIKRLWMIIILQMLVIAALAGVTVSGGVPGLGDIGLDNRPARAGSP